MVTSKFKNFLIPNKEGIDYQEFYAYFVRKVKVKGHIFKEGIFDNILELLFRMDNDMYKEWLNSFRSVDYGLIRRNMEYIIPIVESGKYTDFDKLYEMFCRKNSIVSRYYSNIKKLEVQVETKQLLKDTLTEILTQIDNNNSELVENIKNEYIEMFKDIEDPNLKAFFNKSLSEIPDEVKEYINRRIAAIESRMELNNDSYFIDANFSRARIKMDSFRKQPF